MDAPSLYKEVQALVAALPPTQIKTYLTERSRALYRLQRMTPEEALAHSSVFLEMQIFGLPVQLTSPEKS